MRLKNSRRNRLRKDRPKSKLSRHRGRLIYSWNKKTQRIIKNEKKRSWIRRDRSIRSMSSRFYNRLKKNRGHLLRLVLLLSGIDYIHSGLCNFIYFNYLRCIKLITIYSLEFIDLFYSKYLDYYL